MDPGSLPALVLLVTLTPLQVLSSELQQPPCSPISNGRLGVGHVKIMLAIVPGIWLRLPIRMVAVLPDRDEGAFGGHPAMAEAMTTAVEVPRGGVAAGKEHRATPGMHGGSLGEGDVPFGARRAGPIGDTQIPADPGGGLLALEAGVYPRSARYASVPLAETGGAPVSRVDCCTPTGDGQVPRCQNPR